MKLARLLLLAVLFSGSAQARVDLICLASGERSDGTWTNFRRVPVEVYAAREIYPGENRAFPLYAKIWLRDVPAIAAIDGTSLVLPAVSDAHVRRVFSDGAVHSATDNTNPDDPVPWRIRCMDGGQWVDSRFARPPEAQQEPEPPPRRQIEVQSAPKERADSLMSSDYRKGSTVCRYSSGTVVVVGAYDPCPSALTR